MGFVQNLAILTVGVVVGLLAGLVILFRKKEIPKPVPVDKLEAWKHLEEVSKRKAEILATKNALMEAYKKGKIDEKTYVEESAKLDTKLENIEQEMQETMYMIAKGLVPEFMLDSKKELVKFENLIKMSHEYERLKKELEEVKSERDSLYVKLNELEEEKKDILAKYNWLESNSSKRMSEMQQEITDLKKKLETLARENQFLKEELGEASKPEGEKLKNLRKENELLRNEIDEMRTRLELMQKEVGILLAIIDRYSDKIREGETKTVEELKTLIKPNDPNVKDLIKTYNSPQKAYEYVKNNITEIKPPSNVSFWLDVSDTIKIGAGDNEDRAILLCSMLRAMGENAKVLIAETTKKGRRAFVLLEKSGNYYLLDLDKNRKLTDFVGKDQEEVISKYSTKYGTISKLIYEISDKEVKVY